MGSHFHQRKAPCLHMGHVLEVMWIKKGMFGWTDHLKGVRNRSFSIYLTLLEYAINYIKAIFVNITYIINTYIYIHIPFIQYIHTYRYIYILQPMGYERLIYRYPLATNEPVARMQSSNQVAPALDT